MACNLEEIHDKAFLKDKEDIRKKAKITDGLAKHVCFVGDSNMREVEKHLTKEIEDGLVVIQAPGCSFKSGTSWKERVHDPLKERLSRKPEASIHNF